MDHIPLVTYRKGIFGAYKYSISSNYLKINKTKHSVFFYNNVFDNYVELDTQYLSLYKQLLKINDTDVLLAGYAKHEWLPYTSKNMKSKGIVRFGHRSYMEIFVQRRNSVDKILNNLRDPNVLQLDLTSNIDFFKMYRDGLSPEKSFNYLYLVDENAKEHLSYVVNVANTFNNNKIIDTLFVPYFYTLSSSIEIQLNMYPHNINIANSKEFFDVLNTFDALDKGYILYGLLFASNNIRENDKAFNNMYATHGFKSDELNMVLKIRRENIMKYDSLARKLDNRCSNFKEEFITKLSELNTFSDFPQKYLDDNETLRACNYIKEKVNSLKIADDFDFSNSQTNNIFWYCANEMIFSKEDSIYCPYIDSCDNIVALIQEPTIRVNLENYINEIKKNNNFCKKNVTYVTKDTNINHNLNIEYMPEWYQKMLKGDVVGAFKERQFLIGDFSHTNYANSCSLFLRSDPFVPASVDIDMVSWNDNVNKLVVACLAGKEIIFPIRIVGSVNTDIYREFDHRGKILIGSVLTKRKDGINHELLYYNSKTKKLNGTNFRNLSTYRIFTGSESFKVLYLELTILYFYEQNYGIHLYYYKLNQNDDKDNEIVFVSKYKLDEIKIRYLQLGFQEEQINEILSHLQEVNLVRDNNKRFYYALAQQKKTLDQVPETVNSVSNNMSNSLQTGGKKLNLKYAITTDVTQIPINNSITFKWDIKFDKTNKNFDTEIFPLKTYLKYLDVFVEYMSYTKEEYALFLNLASYLLFIRVNRNIQKGVVENSSTVIPGIADLSSVQITNKLIRNTLNTIMSKTKGRIIKLNDDALLNMYIILKNDLLAKSSNNTVLAISKNHRIISTIGGLQDKSKVQDIIFCEFKYRTSSRALNENKNKIEDMLKNKEINNINIIPINEPMNTTTISNIDKEIKQLKLEPVTTGIIDLTIYVSNLEAYRNNYALPAILSSLLLVLQNLIVGGDLVLMMFPITNKLVFDFIVFVSTMFEESRIEITSNRSTVHFIYIVFKEYKGNVDVDMIKSLIDQVYKYDPTGGFDYEINNQNELKLLNINYKSNNPPNKYLTSIVHSEEDSKLFGFYAQYKKAMKSYYKNYIEKLKMAKKIYFRKNDEDIMETILKNNLRGSFEFAERYQLPLNDNIDRDDLINYYNDVSILL